MLPELADFALPSGVCRHLTPANRCAIYATRPSSCRADDQKPATMSEVAWQRGNHVVCNILMELDEVDPALRIPVEEMYPSS